MTDSSCRLTSCCLCCSLRIGTIVSAVYCIILAAITIVLLFTTDLEFHTIILKVDTWLTKLILTINLVMTILISLLLLIGAVTKRTTLMIPWVVLGVLIILGLLVSVIFSAVKMYLNDEEVYHILYSTFVLIFGLIIVVIYAYFWFVVYSYYQQVKIEKSSLKIGPYGRPYSYQRP